VQLKATCERKHHFRTYIDFHDATKLPHQFTHSGRRCDIGSHGHGRASRSSEDLRETVAEATSKS
jgi:hypothetical protein